MPELMRKYMEEPGFVSAVTSKTVTVTLLGSGGCASCHKSLCVLRDTTSRSVDVPILKSDFHVGDEVVVLMKPSTGYAAVIGLYGIPFFLVMTVMISLLRIPLPEGLVGLGALAILFPYYGILFLLRHYVKQQCHFEVVKR